LVVGLLANFPNLGKLGFLKLLGLFLAFLGNWGQVIGFPTLFLPLIIWGPTFPGRDFPKRAQGFGRFGIWGGV